jgi:hypothetical protein
MIYLPFSIFVLNILSKTGYCINNLNRSRHIDFKKRIAAYVEKTADSMTMRQNLSRKSPQAGWHANRAMAGRKVQGQPKAAFKPFDENSVLLPRFVVRFS